MVMLDNRMPLYAGIEAGIFFSLASRKFLGVNITNYRCQRHFDVKFEYFDALYKIITDVN